MIHSTAVIGNPPEHRDWEQGDPAWLPLIEEDAKVNAFVTVDSGVAGRTYVGHRAFLMKHCHIGHDAHIGDDCELAPGTVIGGHAVLEDGARCGIGVLVLPFKRVGKGARLGAGAVVTKHVPAGEVWVGNPAEEIGAAKRRRALAEEQAEWQQWFESRSA